MQSYFGLNFGKPINSFDFEIIKKEEGIDNLVFMEQMLNH